MSKRILTTRQNNIVTVTLNRPDKHNAVDWDMLRALVKTAHSLKNDRTLRGIIINANGPSFCSGLDFPSFTKSPDRIVRGFMKLGLKPSNLFQEAGVAWRNLPVPVISVVHGRCYGAGLQLILASDFRIAQPDAELSILEAKWGIVPDMSGTITLRELIGIDRAKLLTMTGRTFDAQQAHQWGLLTEISDDPMAMAQSLLTELMTRSPDAIAATKSMFHSTWSATPAQALATERKTQLKVMLGKNFPITLKANAKKQAPRYKKRTWWI